MSKGSPNSHCPLTSKLTLQTIVFSISDFSTSARDIQRINHPRGIACAIPALSSLTSPMQSIMDVESHVSKSL